MATFKDAFTEFLTEKGIKFIDIDERAVRLLWNSSVVPSGISVVVVFDSNNGERVHFMGNRFIKVPEDKTVDLVLACNALNKKYRWFKFYVDTDSDLMVEDDAILSLDNVGDECLEIVIRLVEVVNESYQVLMRALWT